jgi:hypothetical protein
LRHGAQLKNLNFRLRVLIIVLFFITQGCQTPVSSDGTTKAWQENTEVQKNQVPSVDKKERFVKGELIVRFTDTATDQDMEKIISSIGARTLKTVSKERNTFLIQLPEEQSVKKAIKELSKRTDILYAEPNRIYTLGDE